MLQALAIRDVVLIDRLDLAFERGLSVLTGETGAGKSILLDALGLALGARGDAGLVRKGAAGATVTASFEPAPRHPVHAMLREHGIEADGLVILRRTLGADGRSRAFVNDQPASVGLLREIGQALVEVHGQFESHGLLDIATHRAALDAFAAHGALVDDVAAAHAAWRAAADAETAARDEAARAEQDADFLRHALDELDALDPKPGEEAELARQRSMLGAREKLIDALNGALGDLTSQKGVEGNLRTAQRQLERVAAQAAGRLDAALDGARSRGGRDRRGDRRRSRLSAPRSTSIRRRWNAPRSGCSRCARWRASIASTSTAWPALRADDRAPARGDRRPRGRPCAARQIGRGGAGALRRRRGRVEQVAHRRRGQAGQGRDARAAAAQAREGAVPHAARGPARERLERRRASTASSSRSRPTPAAIRARSTASPPAASWRASCWR